MAEKKIRKVVSIKIPLSSFENYLKAEKNEPRAEEVKQVLYKKFGEFPGELVLSVNQSEVQVKWYSSGVTQKAEFFHRKAIDYAKNKDYKKAVASWHEAILLNAADPDYYFYLGLVLLESKKHTESIEPFEKVISLCPIYPKVYLYLGTLFLKVRKFEQAEKYIRESLFFYPDYASSYLNLGIVYSILRNYEMALQMYEKTIQLIPNEARAYLGLAKIYSLQGNIDRANECFHKVIELDKTRQLANYAKRAIIKKPTEIAEINLSGVSVDANANPEDYYSEGYAFYIVGDYLRAEEMYKRYLSLKSDDASVWCALGEVQMRANKLDQAIASLKKAISIDPKGWYYKELAIVFNLNKQAVECFDAVQSALKSGKKDSVTYALGGKSLCDQDKLNEALEMFSESIRLNRNNFMARFHFALALKKLGEFERAVEQLEEIKTITINTPLKQQAGQILDEIINNR